MEKFDYDLHLYEEHARRDPQLMHNYLKNYVFKLILPPNLVSFIEKLEKTDYNEIRAWTLTQLQAPNT